MTNKTISRRLAQRSLIAGAVLASLAGMASAQNVTLFGRLDVGVEYATDRGANGDATTIMRNGGILPSIWGMRGSEDLGGGLKAVFNLESDFAADTGGQRFTGALNPFGRQANVGVSAGWGTVLLGRQYSPALIAELGVEPRGYKESHSGLLTFALGQAPAGNTGIEATPSRNNFLGIFTGNMISYSGSFGPVSVGAGYGLGEGLGGAGRTVSLGASFAGPITVAGSYQQIEGAADAETTRFAVGVAVPFGMMTGKIHFHRSTEDNLAGAEVRETDNLGVGVDIRWNAQNTATIAYYYGKDDGVTDGKTKSLVLSNDYALSKRTTLYAQFVYADVGANASGATQISPGDVIAGEKGQIFGVGVKHDF